MRRNERAILVLAVARTLFVNGQSTEQTVGAAQRLGHALGLRATLLPRWGELQLVAEDEGGTIGTAIAADPLGVEMDRVAQAMRAVDEIVSGRLAQDAATTSIVGIERSPPAPTWLFALAAAAGAVALAVIFGLQHIPAAGLIFVSSGAGALLRRGLGRVSANPFLQPFSAAILAGVIGGVAVRFNLTSSLRLVAVCPCMVLVPGPHFLNSALDLVRGRISLGGARLIYAALIVLAISAGLLLGLALMGVSMPTDPAGTAVPLWKDVIAAGVAVAAYSVFFSTPLTMLPWPIAVGMLAHALRW
ncbi:MAG: threonine/serine exporter family protein, partial [Pseudolabrys sp.]|nr:threonine/serine exporter family protein [Pseudolabrys sp.]